MHKKITGYNDQHSPGVLYLFSGNDIVETINGYFSKEEIKVIMDKRNALYEEEQAKLQAPVPAPVAPEPIPQEPVQEETSELVFEEGFDDQLDDEIQEESGVVFSDDPFGILEKEINDEVVTKDQTVEEEKSISQEPEQTAIDVLTKECKELEAKYNEIVAEKLKLEGQIQEKEKDFKELNEKYNYAIDSYNTLKDSAKESKINTSDNPAISGNFFSALSAIRFSKLSIEIMKDAAGNLTVATMVKHEVQDEGLKNIVPFIITGPASDLDREYLNRISNPIQQVQGLIDNSAEFLKAKELAEKESASKKSEEDKIKKAEEKVSKLVKDNKVEDKDKDKLKKAIIELRKLDPTNTIASKADAILSGDTSLFSGGEPQEDDFDATEEENNE
jgi:hypothetical protein